MVDVWAIAFDPADPKVLFAGTRPAAFWRSGDGGNTWEQLEVPGISTFSDINRGPTRVTQILFDPVARDTVWASVEIGGMYRSTDRGRTWVLLDKGLVSADMHGVAVVPDGAGRTVFVTTNAGLHRSDDGGESWKWQQLDSPWQYTRSIVPHAAEPRTLFLTNGDGPPGTTGRLLRSRDAGRSWEGLPLPGRLNSTPWAVATNASNPQLIFVGTNCGQLFRSHNGGDSWTRLEHEFGELRSLHWRPLTVKQGAHSLALRPQVVKTA
jgi:photosystem II stability/assembly factor-like uncharacterized protein